MLVLLANEASDLDTVDDGNSSQTTVDDDGVATSAIVLSGMAALARTNTGTSA